MSETDVQFYYMTTISDMNFIRISKENDLTITYNEFLKTLEKLVEDCLKLPNTFRINFVMDDDDGNAKLQFYLDNEMKRTDLLTIDSFRQIDDEKINM